MKKHFLAAAVLIAAAGSVAAQVGVSRAQPAVHCLATRASIDTARDEALSVLLSESSMMQETRQELGVRDKMDFTAVRPVRDGALCARIARAFPYPLRAGTPLVVLQAGPVLYARDPDQRRSMGVVLDSAMRVVLRLDAVNP